MITKTNRSSWIDFSSMPGTAHIHHLLQRLQNWRFFYIVPDSSNLKRIREISRDSDLKDSESLPARNIQTVAQNRFPYSRHPETDTLSLEADTSFLSPVPLISQRSIIHDERAWIEEWLSSSPESEKKARSKAVERILKCLNDEAHSLDLGGLLISSLPRLGFLSHVTELNLSCTLIASLASTSLPPNLKIINLLATSVSSLEGLPSHIDIIPNEALFNILPSGKLF